MTVSQVATLVQAGVVPPVVCTGTLVEGDAGAMVFAVDPGDHPLVVGAKVVVDREGEARVVGKVESAQAGRVRVSVERTSAPDKREFPRIDGDVHVRFHVAADTTMAGWLDGQAAHEAAWEPEPFMNFSVTGLQFESDAPVNRDDVLLIALRVPEVDQTWRVGGRVVRVSGEGALRTVAVHFTHLSAGAANALQLHTARVQELLLLDEDAGE